MKQRKIVIDDFDEDYHIELQFHDGILNIEIFEWPDDVNNGHSFMFFKPCPVHGDTTEYCFCQWLWIEEPDDSIYTEGEDKTPFGWWMI